MLDLLIHGGEVIDGTGATRRRADVGIRDGRVVAVGAVDESARRTFDADGRVVAPGFIDVHAHLDAQAFWDTTLSPSPLHGITTLLNGNCGFSVAPISDDSADYLMRMLARVEGMPLTSLINGVPWDWRSTAEYLDRLEGKLAVNTGFMVGHAAIRRVVMGEAACERACTDDELAAMRALLGEGIAAGGLGFSTSISRVHNDADGGPVPSRFAELSELIALAEVCSEFPGTSLELVLGPSRPANQEDYELVTAISRAGGRPLNWNTLRPTAANAEHSFRQLDAGTYAREHGAKVIALTYPVHMPLWYSFASAMGLDAIVGWEETMGLAAPERLQALRDPARRRVLAEAADQPGAVRAFLGEWDSIVIGETFTPETKAYESRTVGEVAAETRKTPFETLLDIVCADELRTTFGPPEPESTDADWQVRLRTWRDDRAVIGSSDAGAHLDMTGSFNYPTLFLQQAVRERELLPLEEAIHYLTDVPARLYGLRDRGLLTAGSAGDVVIFDEDRVGSRPLEMRFDLPGGAGRFYAESDGIEAVVVGGEVIAEHGSFTDARPGTVLRSGRDTDTPSMA